MTPRADLTALALGIALLAVSCASGDTLEGSSQTDQEVSRDLLATDRCQQLVDRADLDGEPSVIRSELHTADLFADWLEARQGSPDTGLRDRSPDEIIAVCLVAAVFQPRFPPGLEDPPAEPWDTALMWMGEDGVIVLDSTGYRGSFRMPSD